MFDIPIHIPLVASTGPVLDRCWQHLASTGPVLAHHGMFKLMGMLINTVPLFGFRCVHVGFGVRASDGPVSTLDVLHGPGEGTPSLRVGRDVPRF